MARYTDANCRLCRREGQKLFLKGERCYSPKCALERRAFPPGQNGQGRRSKTSDYGLQLREKQKTKRFYGLQETQFRNLFDKAARKQGITGENLLIMLETRLDNVVFRLGFAASRKEARQLVTHGHFQVNGKKVNIPSYVCKAGDVIEISSKSVSRQMAVRSIELSRARSVPAWLECNTALLRGTVNREPEREEISPEINEQLIVEFYSR